MNPEFLDLYNRELKLLNEQAREFAAEYPGVAERLGGILEDRVDPLIGGLLEGAAFLAARRRHAGAGDVEQRQHGVLPVPDADLEIPSQLPCRLAGGA